MTRWIRCWQTKLGPYVEGDILRLNKRKSIPPFRKKSFVSIFGVLTPHQLISDLLLRIYLFPPLFSAIWHRASAFSDAESSNVRPSRIVNFAPGTKDFVIHLWPIDNTRSASNLMASCILGVLRASALDKKSWALRRWGDQYSTASEATGCCASTN